MARPIKPTTTAIDSAVANAKAQLLGGKSTTGKLCVEVELPELKNRARVQFSLLAYVKRLMLVQDHEMEVAWHGLVRKLGTGSYHVYDIMVYPQMVTGVTVRTDKPYRDWQNLLGNETFFALRMDGHSHVNMGIKPSDDDRQVRDDVIAQMGGRWQFHIFEICNKRAECNFLIFDLEDNLIYENEDIDITVGDDDLDLKAFLTQAKSMVKPPASAAANAAGVRRAAGYEDDLHDDCDFPPIRQYRLRPQRGVRKGDG